MRRPGRRSVVRSIAAATMSATLVLGATACGDDESDDGSSGETQDEGGVVEERDTDEPSDSGGSGGSFTVETEGDTTSSDPDQGTNAGLNDELGPDFPIDEIPVIDGDNTELSEAGGWLVTVDVAGEDINGVYDVTAGLLEDAGYEVQGKPTDNSGTWTNGDWYVELVTYPGTADGFVTVQYGVTPQ